MSKTGSRSYVFVKKLIIENFKSIKRLELPLKPGVNLLVGPNASGKTNILEAIYFLYKALVEEAGKMPYMPHSPRYWSPLDILYGRNVENILKYEIFLDHYLVNKKNEVYRNEIVYKVFFRISPDKSTILPVYHRIEYGKDTSITVSYEGIEVNMLRHTMEKLMERLKKRSRIEPWLKQLKDIISHAKVSGEYLKIRTAWEREAFMPSAPLMPPPALGMSTREEGFIAGTLFIPFVKPPVIPFAYRLEKSNRKELKGVMVEIPGVLSLEELFASVMRKIILLKHPDIGALREPKLMAGRMERLDERATNLALVMLSIQGKKGGLPPRIIEALRRLFPSIKVRLDMHYGRAALVAEENGLELPPPNMPDGLFKLLAILSAIELEPSILLIDEIENSMHARMLELIIDELNSLKIPVIVASHSPVVVDLVGAERTLIVKKDPIKGTLIEVLEKPEELYKKLDEIGVTLSDYIFYRRTY